MFLKASVVRRAGVKSQEGPGSAAQAVSQRVRELKTVRTVLVIFRELRTVYAASVSTLSPRGYCKQWEKILFLLPLSKLML